MSTYYCRLCFVNSKPEESLLFSRYITEMIECCIPELDMKLVNNPILCAECYDTLEQMLKFKKKCLEVQENMKQMLLTKGASEGVDLSTLFSNKNISSTTLNPNEEIQIGECRSENSRIKVAVEQPLILNGFSDTCDQLMDYLESSINIKTESETVGSTSNVCDSSDNLICTSSSPRPKKSVAIKSRKLKTVKNVVDVKFAKKSCHTCKLSFKSLAELILHLYSEHQKDGELYSCLLCRYKSKKLSSLTSHFTTSHSKCVDLDGSCFFCLTHKGNFQELFAHMTENHYSICKWGKYFCNSCDFISRSYTNFRKHYFQSHDLFCNYCSKYCDDIAGLNRHVGKHFSNSSRRSTVVFKQVV